MRMLGSVPQPVRPLDESVARRAALDCGPSTPLPSPRAHLMPRPFLHAGQRCGRPLSSHACTRQSRWSHCVRRNGMVSSLKQIEHLSASEHQPWSARPTLPPPRVSPVTRHSMLRQSKGCGVFAPALSNYTLAAVALRCRRDLSPRRGRGASTNLALPSPHAHFMRRWRRKGWLGSRPSRGTAPSARRGVGTARRVGAARIARAASSSATVAVRRLKVAVLVRGELGERGRERASRSAARARRRRRRRAHLGLSLIHI